MKRTEYVRNLDADVRYRVSFVTDRGRVVEFVVQLEVVAHHAWTPVVRFDTAHGFAHCDRYKPDGSVERHEAVPTSDFNQALTLATRTVRSQWAAFSKPFREQSP
jgi:hypothetical protein